MPELVEVETFKRQLEEVLLDKKIESFVVTHPRSFRRHSNSADISKKLIGNRICKITRHGKYLAFEFIDGYFLNAHLRMSGRFLSFLNEDYDQTKNPKHTHIIFSTDKNTILFIDPRTFGEMWLTLGPTEETKYGLDAFESTVDQRNFVFENLRKSKRPIKSVLLDQKILSGIGNIYADEICANARLRPTRKIDTLSDGELLRINQSCGSVLAKAIDARGSSLRDESFRDLHGEIGQYQLEHKVHARKTCGFCGQEIEKTKILGRTTYFCPKCQK